MSVTTLPSLHVGGKVTQQVIKHTPQPPSSRGSVSKASRSFKRNSHERKIDFSSEKNSTKVDLNSTESFIDTAR